MDKKNEKLDVEVFDYSTIPKFMQEHGKFCLWRLVMKLGKVKPDKIPYQLNGKRADATNPQHYSSFEETVEAFAKGGYTGIGIGCFEPLRLTPLTRHIPHINHFITETGNLFLILHILNQAEYHVTFLSADNEQKSNQ